MIIQIVYGRERMGEVTGALQLARGVGGTFGTAMLGLIFGFYVKDINTDTLHISQAVSAIFVVISVLCFISFVAAFYLKEKPVTGY